MTRKDIPVFCVDKRYVYAVHLKIFPVCQKRSYLHMALKIHNSLCGQAIYRHHKYDRILENRPYCHALNK